MADDNNRTGSRLRLSVHDMQLGTGSAAEVASNLVPQTTKTRQLGEVMNEITQVLQKLV